MTLTHDTVNRCVNACCHYSIIGHILLVLNVPQVSKMNGNVMRAFPAETVVAFLIHGGHPFVNAI